MRNLIAALGCCAVLFAAAGSACAYADPAATASPAASQQILDQAKDWLGRMQRDDIDRSQMTPELAKAFTDDIAQTLAKEIGPFGPVSGMRLSQVLHRDGNTGYLFDVTFGNGTTATYVFAVEDSSGKLSGLRITPSP